MHGPAVLYEDVMGLALAAFEIQGPMQHGRLKRRLRAQGSCLMCEEGYGPESEWFVKPQIVQQGRDLTEVTTLALSTFPYWRRTVCGKCSGDGSPERCRRHLIEDESLGLLDDLASQRALVSHIAKRLARLACSFQLEFKGTQTEEDAGALISAVGWCSGWQTLLSILDIPTPE